MNTLYRPLAAIATRAILIQEVNANNQSAPTSHYDENKAFNITPATNAKRLQNLQKQATALNMKLVPA